MKYVEMIQDSGVAELAQPLSLSRAASASPLLALKKRNVAESDGDYLEVNDCQPLYNTLPRAESKRHYWNQLSVNQCQSIYSTTDPHYLSAVASSSMTADVLLCPSECDVVLPADASWSSDHLYCNMASVDPLPSLPPRISRRCHSVRFFLFFFIAK